MRNNLVLAAFIVVAYSYFYVSTALIYFSDVESLTDDFFLSLSQMKFVLFTIVLILPAHAYLCYYAWKKKGMDISIVLPFFVLPYMLGATVQALIL